MSICRSLISGVVVAGALAAGGAAVASAAASVDSVALHASDLPAGFKQTEHKAVSNADMAKVTGVSKAQFDQHGRITGLEVTFVHGTTGLFEIASNVYQYKTAGGATWDWQKTLAHDASVAKAAPAPKIGDHSGGFAETQTNGTGKKKVVYVVYGIVVQKGVYDMTAGVIAVKGKATMNDAARFARIMVSRAH